MAFWGSESPQLYMQNMEMAMRAMVLKVLAEQAQ
jgi:hypothetical protein